MASIDVAATGYTQLATGGEGTAANPTQVTMRFAEGETGTIYILNDLEKQAGETPADEGWQWDDSEVFSCTLVSGQKLWGRSSSGTIEIRVLTVNP